MEGLTKKVTIYTDGACSGNPGPGGWGALLRYGEVEKELSGGSAATTNNRMEMMAVIGALEALRGSCLIDLYTDSTYVKNGITQWISAWRKRGWRTSNGKPVKNQDLWERLDQLNGNHEVRWHWVKGHSNDPDNDRVDHLARSAIPQNGENC